MSDAWITTAGLVVVALIGGWWQSRRLAKQDQALETIHLLVNSRMTDTVQRLDTALEKLTAMEQAVSTLTPKEQRKVQAAVDAAGVSTVIPSPGAL